MWDERYAAPGYLFGKAPAAFLTAQAEHLKPGLKALAVADGEGRNSVFMAERGVKVTAMELCAPAGLPQQHPAEKQPSRPTVCPSASGAAIASPSR